METNIRDLLDILSRDDRLSWIVEQLSSSFTEGISQNAKEADLNSQTKSIDTALLSKSERAKREKYETSRPYTDHEKLELTKFALEQVFRTIPAMRHSTFETLREFGYKSAHVEFLVPEEEERNEDTHSTDSIHSEESKSELDRRLNEFLVRISA